MPDKKNLREPLPLPVYDNSSDTEIFQNQVLRSVLKLQNEMYLMLFKEYALRKISGFTVLSTEKKTGFIDQNLQKDHALRNLLIGMTIGMLVPEEMKIYLSDTKAFNKRIITMLAERIKSQMELI